VYPADYPGVIAVAATTASDTLATFSSYGSHTFISAPGVGIISTYSNGSYATMSGTSMAAPEVSGLLGLALAHSNVPASELLDYVKASADKVGPYGYDSKGWNQYFGYGRINAGKLLALLNAPAAVTEEQPTKLETTALNSQTVHGQANNSFSADIAGYIDSIDIANNKVTIKVQTISQNLKIAQNNLVDLYFNDASLIKSGKTILQITELHAGDKLSGKVLWQENKLTAVDLKAQLTVQPSNSHTQASRQRP
jgi:hypothetical protein